MERDALIAHGTSFLLHNRLMNCSAYSTTWVYRTRGSLIYDNGTQRRGFEINWLGRRVLLTMLGSTDNDDTQVRNTLDPNLKSFEKWGCDDGTLWQVSPLSRGSRPS